MVKNNLFKNGNALLKVSLVLIAIMILAVIFAPFICKFNPDAVDMTKRLLSPGMEGHIFGTDGFGRDLFARILYGGRVSLGLSILVVAVNAFLGLIIGSIAAYAGGVVDEIIMRIVDVLMSFPSLILTLFIIGAFGPSLGNMFYALITLGWIGYARMARSLVLSLKEQSFITAAKGIGCNDVRLVFAHIIPNVMPTIIVFAALHIGSTILAISSLSFMGLGVQPPTAEWGTILSEAKQYLSLYPHMIVFPGIAIALSMFSFNMLGDGLRDYVDPRSKKIIST
jgi:ABC-type dipeptide/oligopeptide/nickel transport system permease subunit